jgi:hypothetical protein
MDNVTTQSGANSAYLAARTNFGLIGHSSPVFLALGNHEQEEGWHLDDTGNIATSKPVLGANARKRYYLNPNPIRDPFYSGNVDQVAAVSGDHLLDDYYAWEWGDALFVVIDPYWYTMRKPFTGNLGGGEGSDPGSGDRWDWTLGWTQYAWLQQTLQNSHARYKFIFAHHGTGGTQDYIRGGANGVPYGEWGGRNEDGTTWAFDARRPGWPLPVHDVLVQNGVSAFFHAHDHEYAYEKRDGVVYQLVPMPSDSGNGFGFNLYRETDPYTLRVLPNSGHLRVTVSPSNTNVEYVRAFVSGGTNGQVVHAYTIAPAGGGTPPSPPSVTALSVAPTTVVGGAANATGTVTINTSAPLGGAAVALTSNNAAAAVPASVTVPANATTATFPITTTAVTSSTAATITANLNGSASATLTVTAPAPPSPPSVTALSVSPTSVVGGTGGATGTVTINPSAPQGGATVALTSNNAAATVPASVTVPANATTATFPITTAAVTSSTTATITASLNGSATATLTVTAPAPPATVNPVRINSGGSGYTDGQGRQWSADGSFSGGSAFSSTRTIANTSDQALYQNSRYGSSFTYTINVPAGTYAVTLKFAELYWSSSGGRVFNVSINGTGVLSNFDIVSAAGGSFRAVDRTFTVTTTGPITLRFSVGSAGNPLVNAIQVAPM